MYHPSCIDSSHEVTSLGTFSVLTAEKCKNAVKCGITSFARDFVGGNQSPCLHPTPSPAVPRAVPCAVMMAWWRGGGEARGTEQNHVLMFTWWLTGNTRKKPTGSQVPVHACVETCYPIRDGVTKPLTAVRLWTLRSGGSCIANEWNSCKWSGLILGL